MTKVNTGPFEVFDINRDTDLKLQKYPFTVHERYKLDLSGMISRSRNVILML